jgi:hypothetical protein
MAAQAQGRISFITSFALADNVSGNLTFARTIRLPRSLGFFEIVMPRPGNFSSCPGCVTAVLLLTRIDFPSIVRTMRSHSVSASLSVMSTVVMRSSPWRLNVGCSFYWLLVPN